MARRAPAAGIVRILARLSREIAGRWHPVPSGRGPAHSAWKAGAGARGGRRDTASASRAHPGGGSCTSGVDARISTMRRMVFPSRSRTARVCPCKTSPECRSPATLPKASCRRPTIFRNFYRSGTCLIAIRNLNAAVHELQIPSFNRSRDRPVSSVRFRGRPRRDDADAMRTDRQPQFRALLRV